jgi:nitroimidazol reductase NimA-like FMN-containing flavoprotein (pyridoxamine 5'-phosphate oxidase superfamily)
MARPRDQRIKDTLELLRTEVDVWIATASGAGKPYLVPLSFY